MDTDLQRTRNKTTVRYGLPNRYLRYISIHAVADPAMGGRPLRHWPKLSACSGCTKQSFSDTGAIFYLNPKLLATFCMKMDKKLSLTGQDEGNKSEYKSTTPEDNAREDDVTDEGLRRSGCSHDHRSLWSDDQLLRMLLWRSCRWVISYRCVSRWSGRTRRWLLWVISTRLLLLFIRWRWWIQTPGLLSGWSVRRYLGHDGKSWWVQLSMIYRRYQWHELLHLKLKLKLKLNTKPRRELILELRGVTCHITQCYLPPDTSERAPP